MLGVFKRTEEEIKLAYVTNKLDNTGDFRTVYTDTSLVKNRCGLNNKLNNLGKNPCDRGRPGNKVAILCDDLKAPISMLAFPANVSDQSTVEPLFNSLSVNLIRDKRKKIEVIADKGYTATPEMIEGLNPFNAKLLASKRWVKGTERKRSPKAMRDRMKGRYKIEHLNSRFKQFKRVDKRYERHAFPFDSFLSIAAGLILLECGFRFMSRDREKFKVIYNI